MKEGPRKIVFWSIISLSAFFALLLLAEQSGSTFFPADFFTFGGAAIVCVFLTFCMAFTFG